MFVLVVLALLVVSVLVLVMVMVMPLVVGCDGSCGGKQCGKQPDSSVAIYAVRLKYRGLKVPTYPLGLIGGAVFVESPRHPSVKAGRASVPASEGFEGLWSYDDGPAS